MNFPMQISSLMNGSRTNIAILAPGGSAQKSKSFHSHSQTHFQLQMGLEDVVSQELNWEEGM